MSERFDRPKERPSGVPRTVPASEASALSAEVMRRIKAPHRPVLAVLSGHEVGKRVTVDRTLLVGRDPTADLILADSQVSWRHARIEDRGDSWTLVDLESTNGTMLNGERISETELSPGDKIVFGATLVSFELQDAIEQAYNEAVSRLLNIDDLSGLYVRRKFDAELALLIEAARPKKSAVSLLVMDLDGIKAINDTHGHLFGAYVIGEAGRLIGHVLGQRGIGCRFGGDEYLAALPDHDSEAAVEVAEEIRAAIGRHHFEREEVVLKPGISIGVAAFPEQAPDAVELFQKADEALYRAKKAGKNRVSR